MRNQQKMNQPDCADKCSQVCKLAPVLVDIRINLGISPSRVCSDQPAYNRKHTRTLSAKAQTHTHSLSPSLFVSFFIVFHTNSVCMPVGVSVWYGEQFQTCVCICVRADESSRYLRSPPVCLCLCACSICRLTVTHRGSYRAQLPPAS